MTPCPSSQQSSTETLSCRLCDPPTSTDRLSTGCPALFPRPVFFRLTMRALAHPPLVLVGPVALFLLFLRDLFFCVCMLMIELVFSTRRGGTWVVGRFARCAGSRVASIRGDYGPGPRWKRESAPANSHRRRVLGNMGSHMIAGRKFAVVMMVVMRGAGGAQPAGIYRKSNLS